MATREDLENFAIQNGFYLHPDRDIDNFVEMLNSNGGKCPCDDYRICPCTQAPGEAQRAIQEDRHKEACCPCHFFITPEYMVAWKLRIDTPPTNIEITQEKQPWEIKTPMLIELMETFTKAEKLMEKGKIDEAAETLTTRANESECGMCQNLLATERLRMDYLSALCELDTDECELAKMEAKKRTSRIKTFLQQVDEYAETGQIDGKDINEEENKSPQTIPRKLSSEYHSCLKTMYSNIPDTGALPEKERKVKFAMASKMCAAGTRGEETTVEYELAKYRKEHPELFERQE